MQIPFPDVPRRRGRPRRFPLAVAVLLALLLAGPAAVRAQDDEATAVATPPPIISTETGEVPTTGVSRPGPFNRPAPVVEREGVAPVSLQIEKTQVNAEVERLEIVEGVMQDPTGPFVVAWYEDLGSLGEGGNVVLAGHIDYWNVGPAVFYTLDELAEGDEVDVTGEDGEVYTYLVDWVRQYDADNAPLEEIVGRTTDDNLTLITCGGTFDYANGEYLQRTVVRATRVVE